MKCDLKLNLSPLILILSLVTHINDEGLIKINISKTINHLSESKSQTTIDLYRRIVNKSRHLQYLSFSVKRKPMKQKLITCHLYMT
jgi:hypothetical protein